MEQNAATIVKGKAIELSTFYVGKVQFGIDIIKIQEINKQMTMTTVPQAPEYVLGILNLRGRIVTIIDLAKKLGLSSAGHTVDSRIIIVDSKGEHIGLLVDRIGDVELAKTDEIEPPPANIGGILGSFFEGVFKTKDKLISVLDLEEVFKEQSQ